MMAQNRERASAAMDSVGESISKRQAKVFLAKDSTD
jgi:hypothetical protein